MPKSAARPFQGDRKGRPYYTRIGLFLSCIVGAGLAPALGGAGAHCYTRIGLFLSCIVGAGLAPALGGAGAHCQNVNLTPMRILYRRPYKYEVKHQVLNAARTLRSANR